MEVILESPEHHFLTLLEKMKGREEGWYGLHTAISRKLNHSNLIKDPALIGDKLAALRKESNSLLEGIKQHKETYPDSTLYQFSDGDIIWIVRADSTAEHDRLFEIYKKMAERLNSKICEFTPLAQAFYHYEKMADRKFITAKRAESYKAMTDTNRISSIAVRRKRHDTPVVMVVEDDRFTLTYAAGILGREYEVIQAKNGEEAIEHYINHAPDMVFLDIHLPGLSGHETLEAIKRIDHSAYIVMLSVDTVKNNIVSASQLGAAGFLKKPFSKDRLLAAAALSPFIKQYRIKKSSRL